jgi:CRP/FNR family transcriptional regulator, cyclic AMP receptor protein
MKQGDIIGYIAALLVFVTFWMKTMVPLRITGIVSNVFFIGYGYLAAAYPPLVLHLLLLPLNVMRLREMLQLTQQVEMAAAGNIEVDWLKPFSSSHRMRAGDILFRKGETADRMFFVVSGRCRLVESGIEVAPGAVTGEFALLSPDKTRTQTLRCTEPGELLEITYAQVRQLYFQNPKFGFYFLELTTRRLFENVAALEAEIARLRAPPVPVSDARSLLT